MDINIYLWFCGIIWYTCLIQFSYIALNIMKYRICEFYVMINANILTNCYYYKLLGMLYKKMNIE